MKRKLTLPKPPLPSWFEGKIESIIKSCRTLDHVLVAEATFDLAETQYDITPSQLKVFKHILKVQRWFLTRGLSKGMLVVPISNNDGDVIVAVLEDYDYSIKSSPGISFIRDAVSLESFYCFSILIPYVDEDQLKELNKMSAKDRWNKYCLPTNKIS